MLNGHDTQRLSKKDIRTLRVLLGSMIAFGVIAVAFLITMLVYPFKTIVLGNPYITVTNPDKSVPCNGVITMEAPYTKYIDNPGLIVKTLVREDEDGEYEPLESATTVSYRKSGSGIAKDTFTLKGNPYDVGKSNRVIFSIFYTIYGIRPVMVQFKSEKFEITPSVKCKEQK